jgi:hypothetical protein
MTAQAFGPPLVLGSALDTFAVPPAVEGQLVARGRLILFRADSIQNGLPGSNGEYSVLFGTLVLLDGPVNDEVPEVPHKLDGFRLSGSFLMTLITPRYTAAALPMKNTGRANEFALSPKDPAQPWVLGRLNKIKNKSGTGSWNIDPFTPADAEIALAWLTANPDIKIDPFA